MTITTTAAHAQRMVAAVKAAKTGIGAPVSDPTAEEVRQFWIQKMRDFVQEYERRIAEKAIANTAFDPS